MEGIGVIGCGYWGPNLLRNFHTNPNVEMRSACDLDRDRLAYVKHLYPSVKTVSNYQELLDDPLIDAICIATPVSTHFKFATECMEKGKHILIEKPITSSSEEASALITMAEEKGLVLMVDHTFEYVAAVNKIRELVLNGDLGETYYMSMSRLNLGLFQTDINVIWDLAPHDLSILMYVLGKKPVRVTAQGKAHVYEGVEDVAMLSLGFPDGVVAFMHLSWLDPCKIRRATVVGSRKMLVYDDVESAEKIRIYDKGVEAPRYYDTFGDFRFSYHYGDVVIPRLDSEEPLKRVCQEFVDAIEKGIKPKTDGRSGYNVVRIIEAAQRSLKAGGCPEEIVWEEGQP